jgi:rod shape-determining protein MreC
MKKDMGVIGPQGIVGRIVDVSANYAVVMSAISIQFKVKAKLKKTGENGTIEWDGTNTMYIQMRDIPKNTPVSKGDSILTSELSSIYPPNILVGTIDRVIVDNNSAFYTIKIKTATNFRNVQHVYVIDDLQRAERVKLEESIKK